MKTKEEVPIAGSVQTIGFGTIWKEIPPIAKVMLIGLLIVSILVVKDFIRLALEPGPLVAGEDLYIHIALLFLVPGSLLGLIGVTFGYAYYQICKRLRRQPFWKNLD